MQDSPVPFFFFHAIAFILPDFHYRHGRRLVPCLPLYLLPWFVWTTRYLHILSQLFLHAPMDVLPLRATHLQLYHSRTHCLRLAATYAGRWTDAVPRNRGWPRAWISNTCHLYLRTSSPQDGSVAAVLPTLLLPQYVPAIGRTPGVFFSFLHPVRTFRAAGRAAVTAVRQRRFRHYLHHAARLHLRRRCGRG